MAQKLFYSYVSRKYVRVSHTMNSRTFLSLLFRLTFAAVAIMMSAQCLMKYFSNEIGTRVNYVSTATTKFPEMTLCWRLGYKRNVMKSMGYKLNSQFLVDGDLKNITNLYDFMNHTRFGKDEFLVNVTVKTLGKLDGSYDHVIHNEDFSHLDWRQVALRDEGLCYSTTLPKKFTDVGIFSMIFTFFSHPDFDMESGVDFRSLGWLVIFHHKGQMRRSTSIRVGGKVKFFTVYTVTHEVFRRINGSADCDAGMNEGYDNCWEKTIRQKVKDELQCIFPWNKNVLIPQDDDQLCKAEEKYTEKGEAKVVAELRDTNVKTDCSYPCEILTFSSTTSAELKWKYNNGTPVKNYGKIQVQFPENVKVTEEFKVYGALSMVGEAGGYLGLFLGISCYHMVLSLMDWMNLKRNSMQRNRPLSQVRSTRKITNG